jgi:hypothetical protein
MVIPKYLEAFRRAARETETCEKSGALSGPQNREKSEVGEKRRKQEGLNSLNPLISHPEPPQNAPESDSAVCAVCKAAGDLWHYGDALVHEECAQFLPKPEPAEPSAAYQAVSVEPDSTGCKVEIIELPQAQCYRKVFVVLQTRCPALVDVARWRQCVMDGRKFLAVWGEQAQALKWSSADLFGLASVPAKPPPSYNRLSRYDATGLIWLMQGREGIALTADTASIRHPTGGITVYRKHSKPGARPGG